MSSNLPLRTLRIPSLHHKYLSRGPQRHPFSTTPHLHRTSTTPRADKGQTKAALRGQHGPAPIVNQAEAQSDVGALAEDIGLLQDTLVRARVRDLPAFWRGAFWGYVWRWVKSKGTGMYSRAAYKKLMPGYRSGLKSWVPIEIGNGPQLKDIAKKRYQQIYENFAKADPTPLSQFCLPPLTRHLKTRISSRGPLTMSWRLISYRPTPWLLRKISFNRIDLSARIMSHRAQPLGDEQPDTAYRQVVVRIASRQRLTLSASATADKEGGDISSEIQVPIRKLRWAPESTKRGKEKKNKSREVAGFVDNGKERDVVEYLVLQKRLIRGREEEWKVQGFAVEHTPERLEEDEEYWRKTLDAQAAEMT